MRRAQADADDDVARTALVERFKERMLRSATHYLGDRDRAWDAVQEAFNIALVDKLHAFPADSRVQPYLFKILRNECLQKLRRTRVELAFLARQTIEERVGPVFEGEVFMQEVMRCLSQKLRDVVVLRYSAGCSYKEIAEILGIREKTARSRNCEATRLMLDYLEKS